MEEKEKEEERVYICLSPTKTPSKNENVLQGKVYCVKINTVGINELA